MTDWNSINITRETLSDQVAKKIQEIIIDGEFKPGDQLPPERVLVEKFGVSRTVIREAFRLLQERKLVRIVSGSGIFVTPAISNNISQSLEVLLLRQKAEFQDLAEIRRFMEVEIATMAAQRATDQDIERLTSFVVQMENYLSNIEDPNRIEQFIQADLGFHEAMAQATKNSLFPVLLSSIVDLLRDFRRKASSAPGAPEAALAYHREILEKIGARDAEGARKAMIEHMNNAEMLVEEAIETSPANTNTQTLTV